MKYILGFDTSCYTTSVSIMDETGTLIADKRRLLHVKAGNRGLKQSEMVFQHTRNLPDLLEEALAKLNTPFSLKAVGVSAYPRPLPDSYMPAFLVGLGYAKALAKSHQIPLYLLSHQENHILAGLWSAKGPSSPDFLALHTSGGTTELVKVKREGQKFSLNLLGGTLDISAGQFIDRIGVALHLPFPAGAHLESLAQTNKKTLMDIPFYTKQYNLSFSGSETYATKHMAQEDCDPASIAAGVQLCVAKALTKLIANGIKGTGITNVLFVGGVISNQFIRNYILHFFSQQNKIELYFPAAGLSSDNSVGAAYFACQQQ